MAALRALPLLFLVPVACAGAEGAGRTETQAPPDGAPATSELAPPAKPAPLPVPPSGKHIGATPVEGGVELRVWAPNATRVAVALDDARIDLDPELGGMFAKTVGGAHAGQKYRWVLTTSDGRELLRLDPRERERSGDWSVIVDPRAYVWQSAPFVPAPREAQIVYEMHIGAFNAAAVGEGTFASATAKLDALADLGVTCIELMPVNLHGSQGWGYNPQAYFAPHPALGGPDDLRRFVDGAHARGIAVILDVVFNHYDGWDKAPLRCFDGSCPDGTAGIYFFGKGPYESTPWGPRPDFAKPEVSDFFTDNVFMWMTEYRIDGFRQDSVSNIRGVDGQGLTPGGKELLVRMNEAARKVLPSALLVAEDLKGYEAITGEFGFDTQWDGFFHSAVTNAAVAVNDSARDLGQVRSALLSTMNGDPFDRLLYIESHDTAGNDGARLPARIDAADPTSLAARRRAMLAAGVLLTAPGVPMAFMGQELLEATKFEPNAPPYDWTKETSNAAVRTFYRDLVRLRRNADGKGTALLGKNIAVTHLNDQNGNKVIVYRRWNVVGDDMMVIANFGGQAYTRYDIGLPSDGVWTALVDGDAVRYGKDLGATVPTTVMKIAEARDGLPVTGAIRLGPYSIVVLGKI